MQLHLLTCISVGSAFRSLGDIYSHSPHVLLILVVLIMMTFPLEAQNLCVVMT